MADFTERAVAILQATDDGDQLAPCDLKLIELAVNGFLNPAGEQLFQKLYETVKAGTYRWPWYKGIEHLTLDHAGYVRWKGQAVEHFELAYAHSQEATEYAQEIAQRCRVLEAKGVTPTTHLIVWWDKHVGQPPNPR